ncbi:MAG: response regulator transcription factor [Micrococcales bacterium]
MGFNISQQYEELVLSSFFTARTPDDLCAALIYSQAALPHAIASTIVVVGRDGKAVWYGAQGIVSEHLLHQSDLRIAQDSHLVKVLKDLKPAWSSCDESPITAAFIRAVTNGETTHCICMPIQTTNSVKALALIAVKDADRTSPPPVSAFVATLTSMIFNYWHDCNSSGGAKAFSDKAVAMTDRQAEIAAMVSRGFTNQDIANQLHLSLGTVKVEVSKLLRKFNAATREELRNALVKH